MKNHYKLVLGLAAGIILGTMVHPYQEVFWVQKINEFVMVPMGQIFLRLLFMIVVPMVFSALVLGVYDLAKHQGVGKVASKTLFYTVIASTFSVLIGIGLVNFFQPGKGFKVDTSLFQTSKLLRGHTSGTTGSGLVFQETADSESERWAVWWRYRQKLGISPEDLCGVFGGRCLVPLTQKKPPFWRHSPYTRQIFFSSQHLSQETFRAYLGQIELSNATWVHGYPSSLGLLASWMIDFGVSAPACIKFLTVGAENLSQVVRNRIETAFGRPVYQHYGLAESTANFSQEPDGRIYVDEDFSCVEFLPSDHRASCRSSRSITAA
jgi:hypothetical protein